jgi:hypothetical protein
VPPAKSFFKAVPLVPHPATPGAAARSIVVRLTREPRALGLRYVLAADPGRVRVPPPRPATRTDGLWRHTCFEMFVAEAGSAAYREFNFSPSGEWAAYRFAGYREAGAPLECAAPALAVRTSENGLELEATVACELRGRLRVGLSAVVEAADGSLSYWALRHPSAAPDFHHAAAFAMEIDEVRH